MLPKSAATAKATQTEPQQGQNPVVIDPQQLEKQAYRLLAQVQQIVSVFADIVDTLRKQVVESEAKSQDSEKVAAVAE